jgi:hypothetical protein
LRVILFVRQAQDSAVNLIFFNFTDRIAWRLSAIDPTLFPLPGVTDWFLLNPLFYPHLQIPKLDQSSIIPVGDGKYFWVNSEIVFASNRYDGDQDEERFERLTSMVGDLLIRLRHTSGQATLPRLESLASTGEISIEILPARSDASSWPENLSASRVQKYLWSSAITADRIVAATALGPKYIPLTYESLFLDAIAAHRGDDYRRAILYSAIAAEVALGSAIDACYGRALSARADERFRVIEIPQAGGSVVRKDPVYEKLRNRSDFSVLLHELSLYVLGRSLLVDDPKLFGDAKCLYLTRNQLVHSGELADSTSNPALALDRKGALMALNTTCSLFSWLRVRDNFPLPERDLVQVSQATW